MLILSALLWAAGPPIKGHPYAKALRVMVLTVTDGVNVLNFVYNPYSYPTSEPKLYGELVLALIGTFGTGATWFLNWRIPGQQAAPQTDKLPSRIHPALSWILFDPDVPRPYKTARELALVVSLCFFPISLSHLWKVAQQFRV